MSSHSHPPPIHRTKYRPYFSTEDMVEIISCLKSSPIISPKRLKLIQYLESFNLKIHHGLVEPSHINKPSIAESLGFSEPGVENQSTQSTQSTSPNEQRKLAYEKWKSNPQSCTPDELRKSFEYRYTNKLLSPEEQLEFENLLFNYNG